MILETRKTLIGSIAVLRHNRVYKETFILDVHSKTKYQQIPGNFVVSDVYCELSLNEKTVQNQIKKF